MLIKFTIYFYFNPNIIKKENEIFTTPFSFGFPNCKCHAQLNYN